MDLSSIVTPPALAAFAFAAAIFLVFYGLDRAVSGRAEVIDARLDEYAARQIAGEAAAKSGGKGGSRLGRVLGDKRGSAIATELARADIRLTVSEYVLINLASIVLGAVLLFALFGGSFIMGLVGGIVGFYIPRMYVRFMQGRRLKAFNSQLGDTIVLLSNSLRTGYSLLQSMETVSKELAPPMSTEVSRVCREVGLGLSMQQALANMLRRVPSDDLHLMITAIHVQHEVGGNLAEILDTIAHTIRERIRIMGEIRTITAQQRLSGIILSVLPLVLGVIMYALNPEYISRLWQDICGLAMIATGAVMMAAGYFIIRRITAIEV